MINKIIIKFKSKIEINNLLEYNNILFKIKK